MEEAPVSHRSQRLLSKQHKTDTTPAFHYSLLPSHSTRLLTVTGFGADGTLECTLKAHELVDSLQFHALSYTWGAGLANRTVRCNGKELQITENLYEALTALFPFLQKSGLPIWIDAMCINQHNHPEKEREVQRMDDIYRSASTVLIWLGPEAQDSSLAMQNLPSLAKLLTAIEHIPLWTDLEDYGLPPYGDPLWPAIGHLYQRPWFSRLWTFQEAVLARNIVVFCGEEKVDWYDLFQVGTEMSRTRLKQLATSEERKTTTIDDGFSAVSLVSTTKDYRKEMGDYLAYSEGKLDPKSTEGLLYSNRAAQMPFSSLLLYSQNKLTVDPRDRVYGTLSLAPRDFRNMVRVSYSISLRQLSLEIGKACLQQEQATSYLQFRAGTARSADLPTWCFDLSRPRGDLTPFLNHLRSGFIDADDNPRATIYAFSDEDYIELVAFRVDKIDRIVPSGFSKDTANDKDQDWLRECRELAESISVKRLDVDVAMAYTYTVTGNTLSRVSDGEALKQSFEDFTRVLESQINDPIDKADWYWPPKERMSLFVDTDVQIPRTCAGRSFFTTERGRLGVGPPDVQTGDIVILVYGAGPLFVLREKAGMDAFELVGDAFVHELMELERLAEDLIVPTETFRIV